MTTSKEVKVSYTPGKWQVQIFDKIVTIGSDIKGEGILTVTSGNFQQCKADAELICKAVNERQRLIDLRDHILSMADDAYLSGHPEWNEIINQAKNF